MKKQPTKHQLDMQYTQELSSCKTCMHSDLSAIAKYKPHCQYFGKLVFNDDGICICHQKYISTSL
jgi:hypothetical protein